MSTKANASGCYYLLRVCVEQSAAANRDRAAMALVVAMPAAGLRSPRTRGMPSPSGIHTQEAPLEPETAVDTAAVLRRAGSRTAAQRWPGGDPRPVPAT